MSKPLLGHGILILWPYAMIPGRGADELLHDQALDIDEGRDHLSILAVQVGQEAYQALI